MPEEAAINGKYMSPEEGKTSVTFVRGGVSGRAGWSRLELLLAALSVLLATLAVVLVVVLAAQNVGRGSYDSHDLPHRPGQNTDQPCHLYSVPDPGESRPEQENEYCLTRGCVQAAARLMTAMDASVDPCQDFFEYACGSWNKINIIPDDKAYYNTFQKLIDEVHVIMKDLLEEPVTRKDCEATVKAKDLYASCINETHIDLIGLEPIHKLLEELGGWPVVQGPAWNSTKLDLMDLIVKLLHYNNKVLIDQWVSADDKNSEVNIIQLDQPELGMPSKEYYSKPEHVAVYEKFAGDVAVMFGAEAEAAKREMKQAVDLEIKLAEYTIPDDVRRDTEKIYNRMTVKEFMNLVPEFDWLQYLQKVFRPVDIEITEDEQIVIYAPEYFKKMVEVYHQTDKRVMVNYLIWRIMMNRVDNLPRLYRDVRSEYNKQIWGTTEKARWKECVTLLNDRMGNAVGRLFLQQHFDETSKATALEMIHNIRNAFNELLEESDWMDETTRIVAREKAEAIDEKIGYPESILNDTALDEEYAGSNVSRTNFIENVLFYLQHMSAMVLKRLRDPVDRTKWSTTPTVVNAFYSSAKNQIMFPAAILQPPFYSKDYPKSLNYGGIGMVIGHEITHGFDDKGRQFDKNGNLIQWWDDKVINRFKERAQCIIDQYSNFTMPEINMQLNGVKTQGENIADNGGIKQAFRAYRKWIAKERQGKEELKLPGMRNFTHDQLFFLNFAQVWCGTYRPEAAVNQLHTGFHSPSRFRVIGTLQNLDIFSAAFSCPLSSYMNPSHKCSVW